MLILCCCVSGAVWSKLWLLTHLWGQTQSLRVWTRSVPVSPAVPQSSRGRGTTCWTAEARWCSQTEPGSAEVPRRSERRTLWRSPEGLNAPESPRSDHRRSGKPGTPTNSGEYKDMKTHDQETQVYHQRLNRESDLQNIWEGQWSGFRGQWGGGQGGGLTESCRDPVIRFGPEQLQISALNLKHRPAGRSRVGSCLTPGE